MADIPDSVVLENWILVQGNPDTGEIVYDSEEFDSEYDGPDYRRPENKPYWSLED